MGKLVTFWSPFKGHAKVTSTMCAIIGAFGMQYPEMNVAISHTTPDSTVLEERLDCRNELEKRKELYGKTGVSALALNYMQAVLTSEKTRRCAIPLLMKNLFLYPYTVKEDTMDDLFFFLLTGHLTKEYEIVFLDLGGGMTEASQRFLDVADLIVVVLPQAPEYWNQFFLKESPYLAEKKFCILFGGFLEQSRYSIGYYSRKKGVFACGNLAGEIPMNSGFFDAMSEGRTLEFFMKNQLVTKKEENYGFIVQAKKAAENIRKCLYLS